MPKLSNRPYVPCGSYTDKSKAKEAVKLMPYPCAIVPNKSGTFSIVRKA